MAVHLGTHPSADVLKAFGLGKLDDAATGTVMDHLDLCVDCRKEVASQSGDDFLDRLRQAHGRSSTPAPAKVMSPSVVGPKPATNPSAIPNLPPELANNPHYEILRELGRGGMGVVYLAKNKLMDRLEVLKVVNKALLDRPGSVERFLREIRSAAKLSHANVVAAYSAVQQGDLLAFAMEYVEGEDLSVVVKTQGPLPVPNACFYVQQAALGLQHAFDKKMVHRDIKPQNLILAREGKKHIVKVLDFGLAKVMREKTDDTGLTGEGKMLGTPDYIAPEQTLDAASADIRADIYSLGCTLYFLLSGRPPFSANSLGAILLAHQMKESKPLNLVRSEVPEELASVVRKMMAKSVAKRYQTPLEVVQALGPFVKQGAVPKSSPDLSVGTAKASGMTAVKAESPTAAVPNAKQTLAVPATSPVAWDSLSEGSITSGQRSKSGAVRKRRPPAGMTETQKKWLLGGGIGVGVLLLVLVGMWASGVFKVKTKDGILIVEVNEANSEVYVDGEKVTVSWDKGGKKAEIRIKPGTHKVEVKKDGFVVDGKELAFKDGDREVFTARLLPEKREAKAEPPPENVPPKPETPKPEPKKPDVATAPADPGFMPLFNGKDLDGWEGLTQYWSVKDGALVGYAPEDPKHNTFLCSKKKYSDFELQFKVRLKDGVGNSGVQIRSTVTDTDKFIVAGPQCDMGADYWGSLYGEGKGWGYMMKQSPGELVKNVVKTDDFNDYYIKCVGKHVTITINGETMVDGDFPAMADEGIIAWQIHAGFKSMEVMFKDIRFTDLSKSRADGFVPLFNGKDLTGWIQSNRQPAAWRVFDGVLEVVPGKGSIMTSENFGPDFQLHAEFYIPLYADRKGQARGNSGIFLLGNYEIQILDSYDNPQPPERACASLYGLIGPSRNVCKTPNEWQTYDITFRSPRLDANKKVVQTGELTVVHNGVVVIDKGKFDSPFGGGLSQDIVTTGPIVLQEHGSAVRFRKLLIKPLDAEPNPKLKEKAEFLPLFNGRDLTGWKTHLKQPGNWRVENGILTGSGPGVSHLYTERGDYTDFHLRLEARLNVGSGFRSTGVYFRAPFGPNMPADKPISIAAYNAKIDANRLGGLLIDLTPGLHRTREPVLRPGEWITFEIIAEGNHIVIKVNGQTTADYTDEQRRYTKGHLVLQKHYPATVAEFRNIEIKELPPPKPVDQGFVPLFNGKDLTGWKTHPKQPGNWRVENGVLIGSAPADSYLYTDRSDFKDFHLRVETRINDGGNSGVCFRTLYGPQVPEINPRFYLGYEAQINSTHMDVFKTGSLYAMPGGVLVNVRTSPVPPGQWFTMEAIAEGNHLVIKVNGKTTADYTDEQRRYTKGHIALQQYSAATMAEFRNIEIKELPPPKPVDQDFVPLFNGKDLKGWRTHSRQRGNWRVENGVLIGSGPAVSHLYSSRGNYKNFHLRVEARINDGGNSGVYFRTGFGSAVPANKPTYPLGYEAQIYNSKPGDLSQTGSLYAGIGAPVVSLRESPVRSGEWFTLETIADGNHLVIKVDGKTTVDYRDDKRLFTMGYFALQQHDAQTVAEFRKIEIKELPATPAKK